MPVDRSICFAFRTDVGCFGCDDSQVGHGPALVISPALYNGKTGLMVCCPMKTRIRRAKKKAIVSAEVMLALRAKLKALLQIR